MKRGRVEKYTYSNGWCCARVRAWLAGLSSSSSLPPTRFLYSKTMSVSTIRPLLPTPQGFSHAHRIYIKASVFPLSLSSPGSRRSGGRAFFWSISSDADWILLPSLPALPPALQAVQESMHGCKGDTRKSPHPTPSHSFFLRARKSGASFERWDPLPLEFRTQDGHLLTVPPAAPLAALPVRHSTAMVRTPLSLSYHVVVASEANPRPTAWLLRTLGWAGGGRCLTSGGSLRMQSTSRPSLPSTQRKEDGVRGVVEGSEGRRG